MGLNVFALFLGFGLGSLFSDAASPRLSVYSRKWSLCSPCYPFGSSFLKCQLRLLPIGGER